MEVAFLVLEQVAVIFLLVFVGMLAFKKKLITLESAKVFSGFLVSVVMPMILIKTFQRPFYKEDLFAISIAFITAIVFHLVAAVFVHFFVAKKEKTYSVERVAAMYSNCNFIGLPLLLAVLGEDGVFFGVAFCAVFTIFLWTHGAVTLSEKGVFSIKNVILNPGVICFVLGFSMYLMSYTLPTVIGTTVNYIASMNTPLAMIITGVFLAQVNFKLALKEISVYKASIIRLCVMPLIMFIIITAITKVITVPNAEILISAMVIVSACPTGASAISMSAKFENDSVHCAKIVAVSTFMCIITIPMLVAII